MKFSEVMIYFNYKKTNIARVLDVTRQTVLNWQVKDEIPYPYQCQLEIETKGALKANKED